MKIFASPAVVGLLLAAQTLPPEPAPVAPADPDRRAEATALEKLRYNPRERTALGLELLEDGDAAAAQQALSTAARLTPDNPLARFNAGTGALYAGEESTPDAVEDLEFAAKYAGPELAPAAQYNFGNAKLVAGDPAGAVEAYKESLRRAPGDRDVKHNLELALQLLEQQQEQNEQEQEQEQQEGQPPPDESEPNDNESQDGSEPPDPQEGEQDPEAPPEEPSEGKLPEFEDQPDMTAEQASAILEAVENLEREERRRQAAEKARRQGKKGKDW